MQVSKSHIPGNHRCRSVNRTSQGIIDAAVNRTSQGIIDAAVNRLLSVCCCCSFPFCLFLFFVLFLFSLVCSFVCLRAFAFLSLTQVVTRCCPDRRPERDGLAAVARGPHAPVHGGGAAGVHASLVLVPAVPLYLPCIHAHLRHRPQLRPQGT